MTSWTDEQLAAEVIELRKGLARSVGAVCCLGKHFLGLMELVAPEHKSRASLLLTAVLEHLEAFQIEGVGPVMREMERKADPPEPPAGEAQPDA